MKKLRSLETVRAVAALLVVFYHVNVIFTQRAGAAAFGGAFDYGLRGVDLFFVLSGFIICHVHAGDIGKPRALGAYLFNRVTRLYPAVVIITTCAMFIYLYGFGGGEKAGKLQTWNIVASYTLLPQFGDPLLNVTWTLKYEVFFYAMFALLIVNRRLGLVLMILWQLLVALAALSVVKVPGLAGFYLKPFCLEFGVGMLCAASVGLAARRPLLQNSAAQWVILLSGVGLFIAGMTAGHDAGRSVLYCGIGSGLIITGLVLLEDHTRIRVPWLLTRIGGASYSVYLVHFSVITLIAALLVRVHWSAFSDPLFALVALIAVAAGIAFDGWVDQPIQRILKQRLKPKLFGPAKSRSASAPPASSA